MKQIVIMALLATNCAVVVTESFKCYTCANCADGGHVQTIECRDVPGGNDTESCVRTEFEFEGKVIVNRHCDLHGEECADIRPNSCSTYSDGKTCCCEAELCNSADIINSPVTMATVAAILTLHCCFTGISRSV